MTLPKKETQHFLALLKVQSSLPARDFSPFSVLDLWLWGALIFVSGLPVPAITSL